jgi:hypothetical protein
MVCNKPSTKLSATAAQSALLNEPHRPLHCCSITAGGCDELVAIRRATELSVALLTWELSVAFLPWRVGTRMEKPATREFRWKNELKTFRLRRVLVKDALAKNAGVGAGVGSGVGYDVGPTMPPPQIQQASFPTNSLRKLPPFALHWLLSATNHWHVYWLPALKCHATPLDSSLSAHWGVG